MGLMPNPVDKPAPFQFIEDRFNDATFVKRRADAVAKLTSLLGRNVTVSDLIDKPIVNDGNPLDPVLVDHLKGHWLKEALGNYVLQQYWPGVDPQKVLNELRDGFLEGLHTSMFHEDGSARIPEPLLSVFWVCATEDSTTDVFNLHIVDSPKIVSIFVITPLPSHLQPANVALAQVVTAAQNAAAADAAAVEEMGGGRRPLELREMAVGEMTAAELKKAMDAASDRHRLTPPQLEARRRMLAERARR